MNLGEWILRLGGTVVAALYERGTSTRIHVSHVVFETEPSGDGLTAMVSVMLPTGVQQIAPGPPQVPADRKQAVLELIDRALAEREAPGAGGAPA